MVLIELCVVIYRLRIHYAIMGCLINCIKFCQEAGGGISRLTKQNQKKGEKKRKKIKQKGEGISTQNPDTPLLISSRPPS